MLPRWRRCKKLFSDFNTLSFAGVMGLVMFVMLLVLMMAPTFHGIGSDVPWVSYAVSMPAANREDAIRVFITRDGKVYMGVEQIDPIRLPEKISDCLKDTSVERKVYIVADQRARWVTVKKVLEGIRAAGILRVAFLVNQRRTTIASRAAF